MKKLFLTILLIFSFLSLASADKVDKFFNYGVNSEVNNLRLNGNIDNILRVINGGLDNTNADVTDGFRFIEILSALPLAGEEGRAVFLTTDDTFNFDTGTAFNAVITVPGTPAQGEILYFDGIWQRLAVGTLGQFLQTQGASADPSWQKVDLADTNDITGTLAVGNGGTGLTSGDFSRTAGGDLGGTYPSPTVDAVQAGIIDATAISTSFMGVFSKNVSEETNTLIIAGSFENKWIIYQGYLRQGTNEIPGGSDDAAALGEHWRTAGEATTPVHSQGSGNQADTKNDSFSIFSGRFYSESGITAPGTTDVYNSSAPEGLCVESADADNDFDTDCFLYVDATSEDVMLHVGTLNPGSIVDFSIFITILPDTAL